MIGETGYDKLMKKKLADAQKADEDARDKRFAPILVLSISGPGEPAEESMDDEPSSEESTPQDLECPGCHACLQMKDGKLEVKDDKPPSSSERPM